MAGLYWQGIRTPDGPMVVTHESGREPWSCSNEELEWNTPNGRIALAGYLLWQSALDHVFEEAWEEFVECFLTNLSDRWTITFEEVLRWYNSHPDWVEADKRIPF